MVRCYCRAGEEEYDAMLMQEIDIHNFARQLLEAHGDKAVAEAAQRASRSKSKGIGSRPKLGSILRHR